jgi:hypothetical protein
VDDDEELEETQPRRRRRPADDDDDEERPRGRRQAPEDDEEDEDVEDAPRGRRSRVQEDEEADERPRSRRRSRVQEDEEEDAPRRRRGTGGRVESKRRIASGWGAYERSRAASSDFETKFKPNGEIQVIALLEPEPFHSFARHWVDLKDGANTVKRAFVCPASVQYIDEEGEPVDPPECPLCDVGHKPNSPKAYLNVAVLGSGKPVLAVWEIGPQVSEQLQMIDKSIGRRTSLTDIYLLATATGSGLNTKYHLEPLMDEEDVLDLAEEERITLKPLTDAQRNGFELYDDSLYPVPSMKELDQIADQIA